MISIPLYEAKTRLSELLVQVQAGQEFTITRHGEPMARLVPATRVMASRGEASRRKSVDATFATLADLRKGVLLDLPLREAIELGRD